MGLISRFDAWQVIAYARLYLVCKEPSRKINESIDTLIVYKDQSSIKKGALCDKRSPWWYCADTRLAVKSRPAFSTNRWGHSGALFAWDLWNKIHPAHAGDIVAVFNDFVIDASALLRQQELVLHRRSHLQTVAVFEPVLTSHPQAVDCIFKHPALDFASVHSYESGTIDHQKNTFHLAISTGRLTKKSILHIDDQRLFLIVNMGPFTASRKRRPWRWLLMMNIFCVCNG